MEQQQFSVSVREMISNTMQAGDIHTFFLSSSRAVDGIKAHQAVQNHAGDNYEKEVSIEDEIIHEDIELKVTGRIDGVIDDDCIILDEIKSTHRPVEEIKEDDNPKYWAQVKIYGYMYCKKNQLSGIYLQLTYYELGKKRQKKFKNHYTIDTLKQFYDEITGRYIAWLKQCQEWKRTRNKSIEVLEFPFRHLREGQKKLMGSVYKTITTGERLFVRAPTGTGKTIGTLYPAIKALQQGYGDKIFYLTAKTIGKEAASKALDILEKQGLQIKRIVITAKDKICLNGIKKCDPNYCPYAKGHYDRLREPLNEMLESVNNYNRETIVKYARQYQLCPYELSLDLALYCDCIICDYNYMFDLTARLRRFFEEVKEDYIILIDEAHNLVNRARDMYSSVIEKTTILALKKLIKEKDKTLYKYFNQLNQALIEIRHQHVLKETEYMVENEMPESLVDILRGIVFRIEKLFSGLKDWDHIDSLLDFYFLSYDFIKKSELYNDKYRTYYEKVKSNIKVKMFCIDPSENLSNCMEKVKALIFFSATLIPMNYFVKLLYNKKSYGLVLESPFEQKNLCLISNHTVSTKYRNRASTYHRVCVSIYSTAQSKKGNYLVFFPSYDYMHQVHQRFMEQYEESQLETIVQDRNLSEQGKELFLTEFDKDRDNTLIAFAVLGGNFGEGIDLVGEKLSGAIIVGVGLPMICFERNLIKDYFNDNNHSGYSYAYLYPGFNKVMQAAGRVIRTEKDKGVVVLIDERYGYKSYQSIFPKEWKHMQYVHEKQLDKIIQAFWRD